MVVTATSSADVLNGFAPPVPPAVIERARAFEVASSEGAEPVAPRLASSVVLLRDGSSDPAAGLEVYLLHRHARMSFAPSVAAFPGGGLDPADGTATDPLVACALRETTEETTVRLSAADLVPWARWVTPAYEPRRFATSFFLARLPAGQEAQDVSGETDRAEWVRPVDALSARAAGSLSLMPPTWSILLELADVPGVDAALSSGRERDVRTVLPRLVRDSETWAFAYDVVA